MGKAAAVAVEALAHGKAPAGLGAHAVGALALTGGLVLGIRRARHTLHGLLLGRRRDRWVVQETAFLAASARALRKVRAGLLRDGLVAALARRAIK